MNTSLLARYSYCWDLSDPYSLLSDKSLSEYVIYDDSNIILNKKASGAAIIMLTQGGLEIGKKYKASVNLVFPTYEGATYFNITNCYWYNGGIIGAQLGASSTVPGSRSITFVAADTEFGLWLGGNSKLGIKEIKIEAIDLTELDTIDGSGVLLNFRAFDIEDLSKVTGNYSKEIVLPGTPRNNKFFKYIFNVNEDATYNTKKNVEAHLCYLNQVYFDGHFRLISLTRDVRDEKIFTYNIVFFDTFIDIITKMGQKKLNELVGIEELNHIVTKELVTEGWLYPNNTSASQVSSGGTSLTGKIVYPVVDYGHQTVSLQYGSDFLWFPDTGATQSPTTDYSKVWYTNRGYHICDVYPSVSVKYYWDKIFENYNLTCEGDFFNTDLWKSLIIPFHNDKNVLNNYSMIFDGLGEYTPYVHRTVWYDSVGDSHVVELGGETENNAQSWPLGRSSWEPDCYFYYQYGGASNWGQNKELCPKSVLNMMPAYTSSWIQDPYYNYFSNFNVNDVGNQVQSGGFKIKRKGKYKLGGLFKSTVDIEIIGVRIEQRSVTLYHEAAFPWFGFWINHYNNCQNTSYFHKKSMGTISFAQGNTQQWVTLTDVEFECEVGDTIYIGWRAHPDHPEYIKPLTQYAGTIGYYPQLGCRMRIYEHNYGLNTPLYARDFASSMLQIDFFKSIMKMLNMRYTIDVDKPNNLIFRVPDEYHTSAITYDWSQKLCENTEVYTMPTDYQDKEILLTYKKGDDFYSESWKKDYGLGEYIYGYKKVGFDIDSKDTIQKIELNFASAPIGCTYKLQYNNKPQFVWTRFINMDTQGNQDTTDQFTERDPFIGIYNQYYIPGYASTTTRFLFQGSTYIKFPYVGHMKNPTEWTYTSDNIDINFDTNYPYYPAQTLTKNNLYNNYWKNQIYHFNNKNTRIKDAKYYLELEDMNKLKLNDIIFDNGTYYEIISIKDYNPEIKITDCTLITYPYTFYNTEVSGDTTNYDPVVGEFVIDLGREQFPDRIFRSGNATNYVSHYDPNGFPIDTDGILLGENNRVTAISSSTMNSFMILGDNNLSTTNNVIVGDSNRTQYENSIIYGDNNDVKSSDSILLGCNNVEIVENITNVVVIGKNNAKIEDSNTIYIGDIAIQGGVIKSNGNVKEGGYNDVQNPFGIDIINISDGGFCSNRLLTSLRARNVSDGGLNRV